MLRSFVGTNEITQAGSQMQINVNSYIQELRGVNAVKNVPTLKNLIISYDQFLFIS